MKKLPASNKAKEFNLISQFNLGYRAREDHTNLAPNVLVSPSKNVLTNTAGRIAHRQGYTLDGQASTVIAPIATAFDWQTHVGLTQHLRAGFLSSGNDAKLQYRFEASDGTVTWNDLITDLTSANFAFTDYWDATNSQAYLLMVNGTSNIYEWSGGVATYAASNFTNGVISSLDYYPTIGGSGYTAGDVLTITTGGTGATATVVTVSQNAIATINATPTAAGTGYTVGDVLTVLGVGLGGSVTVATTSGGGVVTGITLLRQGNSYAVATGIATSGGSGSGCTIEIQTLANDCVAAVVLDTPGINYTTGTGKATSGGTGTGATLHILTVVKGAISIQGDLSAPERGFYASGGGQISLNNTTYTYITIIGNSFVGVAPDPSLVVHTVGDVINQVVRTQPNSTGLPQAFTNDGIANLRNQIYIGSKMSNTVYISAVNNYKSYTFTAPVRLVGEGASVTMDGPWIAFAPQEDQMYMFAGKDLAYETQFILSSDLESESFQIHPIKTTIQQAPQSQKLTTNIKNDVAYVSNEPILNTLGRVDNVVLTPQITDISWTIVDDFNSYDFTDGQVFYFRKYIFVAVPKEGLIRIYNMTDDGEAGKSPNHYWEAPQSLPLSCFSVIDGELYGHSYLTCETYKLFDGYNDNGHPISVNATFAYNNHGVRTNNKSFTEFYSEGYIASNTTLTETFTYDIDGKVTMASKDVVGTDTQIVGISSNLNSLGKYSLGKQPLGSNIDTGSTLPPKWRVIKTLPRIPYYEYQASFTSTGVDNQWELLAFGPAATITTEGNNPITQ